VSAIKLVLADVDGTLVTPEKVLTDRARTAVRKLNESGIAFAITSGRPPRGMSMLIAPLELTTPIAGFNGGMLVNPDLSPIDEQSLPTPLVAPLIDTILRHGLDVWIYRGADWFVRDVNAPHVDRERRTVCFAPTVTPDFADLHQRIVKVVGVGEDLPVVARCEEDVRAQFGDHVSAARSQPYYLDVTHPNANKGAVVKRLSGLLDVAPEMIATVGDMPTDVLMFALSGLSIAMGNSSLEVKRAARRVTASNDDEGFAKAMEQYILPAAPSG
jgi:Cof subfamily protein (haloacid dehalogenase superfamily)